MNTRGSSSGRRQRENVNSCQPRPETAPRDSAVAVEDGDLQSAPRRRGPAAVAHAASATGAARSKPAGGEIERVLAVLACGIASASARRRPPRATRSASQSRSTSPRRECRSRGPGRASPSCDAAGDGQARDRMAAQIFEHAADEIAHVDQRMLGQVMQPRTAASEVCRCAAAIWAGRRRARRRCRDGSSGSRPRRNTARRCRSCRGSTAADNAEPAVHGALGDLLAAGDGDLDAVDASAETRGHFASAARIMARGPGLIAGSPTASGRPGRVTVPTPSPGREASPCRAARAARSRRRARHA